MPDSRAHRGAHPQDAELFGKEQWTRLRQATADLSWLLAKGYAEKSATKLVGDRYRLTARQRIAVWRSACSDNVRAARIERRLEPSRVRGRPLFLDGFNVLTTIEVALAGGVLLRGRDDCLRDLAGVHGSYRKVAETMAAIGLLGEMLVDLGVGPCVWLLDRPVSNSGRLQTILRGTAAERGWAWEIELVSSPDRRLIESGQPVASADSVILDRCGDWFDLASHTVTLGVPNAWIVDLSAAEVSQE